LHSSVFHAYILRYILTYSKFIYVITINYYFLDKRIFM
jgi:hypothetical protein